MSVIRFWSYANNSQGMVALREELRRRGHNAKAILQRGSNYRYRSNHVVLNWGAHDRPLWGIGFNDEAMLNGADAVATASNKISCFEALDRHDVPIPEWTTRESLAKQWLTGESVDVVPPEQIEALDLVDRLHTLGVLDTVPFEDTGISNLQTNIHDVYPTVIEHNTNNTFVYCRTLSRASQGRGIVVAKTRDELVNAPLYTRGIECKREYRIHMFKGEMIDLVAKCIPSRIDDLGSAEPNDLIRNHHFGWVFARDAVTIPDEIIGQLKEIGSATMSALGLDFGAIDVVRDFDNNIYVLEVNTAPGMEGTTISRYADAIESLT